MVKYICHCVAEDVTVKDTQHILPDDLGALKSIWDVTRRNTLCKVHLQVTIYYITENVITTRMCCIDIYSYSNSLYFDQIDKNYDIKSYSSKIYLGRSSYDLILDFQLIRITFFCMNEYAGQNNSAYGLSRV